MCFKAVLKCLCCCKKGKGGLNETSFYEYSDVLPKYYNNQIGTLSEGVSYTVTGQILTNCERFSINFVLDNEDKDVALHINPRLPQNYIVRNTKVRGVWGQEEIASALPFTLQRGERFSIQILVTDTCYMISVNGRHFAEYEHRLPYRAVSILEVKGGVDSIEMDCNVATEYPHLTQDSEAIPIRLTLENTQTESSTDAGNSPLAEDEVDGLHIPREWRLIPTKHKVANILAALDIPDKSTSGLTMPYYGRLPARSLTEGRCLKIEGRVRLLPHSFYINLQQGQHHWPHPIIAFHFNPRFSKHSGTLGQAVVIRNAWYDGKWASEERSEVDTHFRPGKTFSIAICCASDAFEVYVNRKFITEFKYHIKPDIVDVVYIKGDIKLWDVVLETDRAIKGRTGRIYQNPGYTDDA